MNDCHLTMLGIHAFTQKPRFLSFFLFLEARIERAKERKSVLTHA